MVFSKNCDACGGVGRLAQTNCGALFGSRCRDAQRNHHGSHPRWRWDGARIRVPEKGNAGERGGRVGRPLSLRSRWSRTSRSARGRRPPHVVAIGVHEAALGAKIEVPAPDGPARLRVPPGTQTGQRFRVQRPRRAIAARRRAGRSGGRSEDHAAQAARRTLERAAARIRSHQR